MAWQGDVERKIEAARPDAETGGCTLVFECGHEQRSNFSAAHALAQIRLTTCVACSKPIWDKLAAQREQSVFEPDGIVRIRL